MNYKRAFLVVAVFLVVLSLLLLVYSWFIYSPERCSTVKSMDASIIIESASRSIIGINTNTKYLEFGTSSPSSIVQRSITTNYSQDAQVQVLMIGPLASWVGITPNNFNLLAGENKPVDFVVNVPVNASEGLYNGTAIFCFRE